MRKAPSRQGRHVPPSPSKSKRICVSNSIPEHDAYGIVKGGGAGYSAPLTSAARLGQRHKIIQRKLDCASSLRVGVVKFCTKGQSYLAPLLCTMYHSYRECPRVGRPLSMILPADLSMRAECMHEK